MKIIRVAQKISAAIVEIDTTDNRRFWMKVDDAGFHFHSQISSSGALESKPISKTADEVFQWIGQCDGGSNKFGDRKGVQPKE